MIRITTSNFYIKIGSFGVTFRVIWIFFRMNSLNGTSKDSKVKVQLTSLLGFCPVAVITLSLGVRMLSVLSPTSERRGFHVALPTKHNTIKQILINSSKTETQVWLTISLLLPTHFPCIWYHWKALLFLFTMMCHLLWLCNLGMCSTPEYGGGCKVKCAKMHCYSIVIHSKNSRVRLIWNPGKNYRNLSPKCVSDSDSASVWPGFRIGLTPKWVWPHRTLFLVKSDPGVFRVYDNTIAMHFGTFHFTPTPIFRCAAHPQIA